MKAKLTVVALLVSTFCSGLAGAEQVRLMEGTPVHVRLKSSLASEQAREGARVDFEVAQPVVVGGVTLIPKSAVAWGAVQGVKKKKYIRFDIEGLLLPSLQQVKLRSVRERPRNPDKDQIRIETKLGDDVGAARGAEFMAYVAADVNVDVQPPAPAAVAPPLPASANAATPAPSGASEGGEFQTSADLVTVQCFSEPSGADIVIDGDFMGDTPSILKVTPSKHVLEIQLEGYRTVSQTLELTSNTRLQTVRVTLEKIQ